MSIFVIMVSFTPVSATSYGLDGYDSDYLDIKTRIPLDIWYEDIGEGITEFPIHVEVKTLSHQGGNWDWYKLVASEVSLRVRATDHTYSIWTSPSWMIVADYHVLCDQYGTTRTDTYKAGVSGSYGDGETYSVGAKFEWSWTYYSSPIGSMWMTYTETSQGSIFNLGTLDVDISEQGGHNNENLGMTFVVGIPNESAASHDNHQFYFEVTVTVVWQHYLYFFGWSKTAYTTSESHSIWIGNNNPTGDASLYLLEALDWTGSYS